MYRRYSKELGGGAGRGGKVLPLLLIFPLYFLSKLQDSIRLSTNGCTFYEERVFLIFFHLKSPFRRGNTQRLLRWKIKSQYNFEYLSGSKNWKSARRIRRYNLDRKSEEFWILIFVEWLGDEMSLEATLVSQDWIFFFILFCVTNLSKTRLDFC